MRFIQIFTLALLGLMGNIGLSNGAAIELTLATNLQQDGKLAEQKQIPILVMFSAEHCVYCSALEADQLRPMIISGEYDNQVIIRNLRIDSLEDIVYFDGKPVSGEALAAKYNVWVTPTIMFFDHTGKPLAPKIIGYNTPEMFGGYLDESIEKSRHMLRTKLAQR